MATTEEGRTEFLTLEELPTKRYPDVEEFLARMENGDTLGRPIGRRTFYRGLANSDGGLRRAGKDVWEVLKRGHN